MLSNFSLEKILIVFVSALSVGLTWLIHDGGALLEVFVAVYIVGALIAHWLLSSVPNPSESITNPSSPLIP